MVLDREAQHDERAGRDHREPAALAELLEHGDDQDGDAHHPRYHVDSDVVSPIGMLFARVAAEPVAEHRCLRQRERQEDVDRVEHDERVDLASGVQQHEEPGAAHQQHPVLHSEPVAQRAEPVREPGIVRHVRHHARPVDEASLCRHEEE